MISADFQSSRTVAINATVHLFQEATIRKFLTVRQAELEYDRYRVIDVQATQVDRDLETVIGKLSKEGEKK